MLVAPLAGVLLYAAYLGFLYQEHNAGREQIERIRTQHLPVLEIAGSNVLLFGNLTATFKDAVLAGNGVGAQHAERPAAD